MCNRISQILQQGSQITRTGKVVMAVWHWFGVEDQFGEQAEPGEFDGGWVGEDCSNAYQDPIFFFPQPYILPKAPQIFANKRAGISPKRPIGSQVTYGLSWDFWSFPLT